MTAAPQKSISFHWKPKDIDSIKWAATKKLLTDLVLLSKYLRNNYFLKGNNNSEAIPKKVEKHFSCRKYMFGGSNPCGMIVSSSVKYASNYRASRLAHYQDQMNEDATNLASLRPSRRSSNLSGYSINSLYDGTTLQPMLGESQTIVTDDVLNNNDQRITSDDAPSNVHCKITQSSNIPESKGETRRKSSKNEIGFNARSQSIGPTSNVNNRAVLTSIHNRSNPDTFELAQLGTRSDSGTRNNQNSRPCYFCWCCCCSCSCLNIKPKPEESSRTPISNEPQSKIETVIADERFSLEDAQKWAQNFEFLMQSSAGRKVFQEFLKLEYSEENIMFYKAVEDLQTETNDGLIEEKARSIYEDYISILSPKEVSLDSRVRELINSDMVEPSSHIFDEAQLQIFTLMQRDSYPRFLNSSLYKDLSRQFGGTSTTSNSQTLSETRPINNS